MSMIKRVNPDESVKGDVKGYFIACLYRRTVSQHCPEYTDLEYQGQRPDCLYL